jgi:hypothetical protein
MSWSERFRHRIRRVIRQVGAAPGGVREVHNVNVVEPNNAVVSRNVAADGSVHGVSSRQSVRVRQNGEETIEETDTDTVETSY